MYAAEKNNSWSNVKLADNASDPVIVFSCLEQAVHAAWSANDDIYYAKIPLPLSSNGFVPLNIVDDTSGAVQSKPTITHACVNGREKVFVAWTDSRNDLNNGDNDIYFASVGNTAGTNILANVDSDLTDQDTPAIGVTDKGAPYIIFQDNDENGSTVKMSCATVIQSVIQRTLIESEQGGYVGPEVDQIDSLDDLSIYVRPNGISTDTELTISKVSNPPGDASGLVSLFSYDFGPSSTREFRKPVTITIPYPAVLDGVEVSVYWYNPQTGSYSQTGMSNIKTIDIGNNIKAVSFDTTHFCQYSVSSKKTD